MKTGRLVLVLLLLVLGCGLAHSRTLTKCELKNLIMSQTQNNAYIGSTTIAKMVCHAEKLTGLTTDVEGQITVGTDIWKLYGIFQLSNHMACLEAGQSGSRECTNACSDFLDNNVNDDIACAVTIIENILNGNGNADLTELIRQDKYFPGECKDVTSDYVSCGNSGNSGNSAT